MEKVSRYRNALMGFAALWIYYVHILPIGIFKSPNLSEVEWYFHRIGFCGVDIFLILSSFGLCYSFKKKPVNDIKSYWEYLKRRLVRIFSIYAPITLIIAYIDNWPARDLYLKILGVYQIKYNVYVFLWFVPCILIFYMLTPLYYKLLQWVNNKYMKFILTAIVSAIVVWACVTFKENIRDDLYAIIVRIPVFLLGFCFGDMATGDTRDISIVTKLLCIVVMLIGFDYSYKLNKGIVAEMFTANNALANVLIVPGLIIVLSYIFYLCDKNVITACIVKFFTFFGMISFEFYCWQEWLWSKISVMSSMSVLQQHLWCFGLTLCFALIIHYANSLFVNIKKHKIDSRRLTNKDKNNKLRTIDDKCNEEKSRLRTN